MNNCFTCKMVLYFQVTYEESINVLNFSLILCPGSVIEKFKETFRWKKDKNNSGSLI